MNYIVLNGVKSNTIKGLLIQSLPPISKPQIRTQTEEIDGRDGDIVTALGYSAYDKDMTIGLYGDYDVNDVIRYFDSNGIVTFSNEPDKYYIYQIVKQIDFDRLIRFRTAKVTFHVQPFKYSAIDQTFTKINQFIDIDNYSATKNGIELNVSGGTIAISGTGTLATEFYVPIKCNVDAGNYTLKASASGTKASACSIRLIGEVPSNADSFGGNYLGLKNDATATLSASVTASKKYNYLWFYITQGTAMDFSLDVALQDDDFDSVTLINRGNTLAKPNVTVYGTDTVTLSLNGTQIFIIDIADAGFITIDSAQMNAYQGDTLMNRRVVGDYERLLLNVGTNTISWDGDVTGVEVVNFSRWI